MERKDQSGMFIWAASNPLFLPSYSIALSTLLLQQLTHITCLRSILPPVLYLLQYFLSILFSYIRIGKFLYRVTSLIQYISYWPYLTPYRCSCWSPLHHFLTVFDNLVIDNATTSPSIDRLVTSPTPSTTNLLPSPHLTLLVHQVIEVLSVTFGPAKPGSRISQGFFSIALSPLQDPAKTSNIECRANLCGIYLKEVRGN